MFVVLCTNIYYSTTQCCRVICQCVSLVFSQQLLLFKLSSNPTYSRVRKLSFAIVQKIALRIVYIVTNTTTTKKLQQQQKTTPPQPPPPPPPPTTTTVNIAPPPF